MECGHTCKGTCSKCKDGHIPCIEECKRKLECGHICKGKCYECKEGHIPCTEPCERKLECGHQCQNECGEECTKQCEIIIKLSGKSFPCGHPQFVECYKRNDPIQCQTV